MEKSYETFVTDLRKLLLAAMDLKEEEIYFSNDGEKYGCLGDRLFVESGHMEKAKTVCGLHTEELYKTEGTVRNILLKISFMIVLGR